MYLLYYQRKVVSLSTSSTTGSVGTPNITRSTPELGPYCNIAHHNFLPCSFNIYRSIVSLDFVVYGRYLRISSVFQCLWHSNTIHTQTLSIQVLCVLRKPPVRNQYLMQIYFIKNLLLYSSVCSFILSQLSAQTISSRIVRRIKEKAGKQFIKHVNNS